MTRVNDKGGKSGKGADHGLASTMALMGDDAATQGPALPFGSQERQWSLDEDTVRFKLDELNSDTDPCVLLWCAEDAAAHARRHRPFRPVLDKLAEAAPDPELDDPALADDPQQAEQRREVFEVLTNAQDTPIKGLPSLLRRALRPDGKMVPPLALLVGTMEVEYDGKAALAATVDSTRSLASQIKELEPALARAQALLEGSGPGLSTGVYRAARDGVHDALRDAGHPAIATNVAAGVDEALLEQRQYQRYEVLGGEHVRAMLAQPGAGAASGQTRLSVYLPVEVIPQLPMKPSFRARLLGHVHIDVDRRSRLSLACCALVRVIDDLAAALTASH